MKTSDIEMNNSTVQCNPAFVEDEDKTENVVSLTEPTNSKKEDFDIDVKVGSLPQNNEVDIREPQSDENIVLGLILFPLLKIKEFLQTQKGRIFLIIKLILLGGYIAYMVLALRANLGAALPLLVIFCAVVLYWLYCLVRNHFGENIWTLYKPIHVKISSNIYWIKWIFIATFVALFATWIALDTSKRPRQLISLTGYFVVIACLFLGSKYPHKVWWRPVLWGFAVQMVFAVFILRTSAGFAAFNWLGKFVQRFLNFTDAGAAFIFGSGFREHYFAFKVLPIIIYFSSVIAVMYYLGAMQWLIFKLAWLMQFSLGTSATESMCAAGNIFVGMTESPLLIRPYIDDVTTSEMHAIMVSGFGTIAGSVLGAYLGYGINPVYLITACFMAAPTCLAVAKLVYPETEQSKFKNLGTLKLEKTKQRNVIEAAATGAMEVVPVVLNIAANIIAFLSILSALNALLGWYGGLLDFPQLSFELICSYVFLPITFLMGIEWQDCFACAELLGIKIFLNEFVAYEKLSAFIDNRSNGSIPRSDETGTTNWIDVRSEAIITYALCGFANIGSIAIILGGLSALCPQRQSEMASIVIRALICGIMVSVLNGCIAGFLYAPSGVDCQMIFNRATLNYTLEKDVFICCSQLFGSNLTNDVLSLNATCLCCEYQFQSSNLNNTLCSTNICIY